jgi:hypothetical protein
VGADRRDCSDLNLHLEAVLPPRSDAGSRAEPFAARASDLGVNRHRERVAALASWLCGAQALLREECRGHALDGPLSHGPHPAPATPRSVLAILPWQALPLVVQRVPTERPGTRSGLTTIPVDRAPRWRPGPAQHRQPWQLSAGRDESLGNLLLQCTS